MCGAWERLLQRMLQSIEFAETLTNSSCTLDVDVIADFPATNYPGSSGLSLDEVREALLVFAAADRNSLLLR